MKIIHVFFILTSCLLYSAPYDTYLEFLEKYPVPKGDYHAGEIEIVTDPSLIPSIEETAKARLLKNGYSEAQAQEFSRVGIVMEDQYWVLLRDAVIFPTGAKGTYNRLSWKCALKGPGGVAVLAVLPNGKIVLNLNFRHATRSWELELPRGGIKEKESIESAALRELREETGLNVSRWLSYSPLEDAYTFKRGHKVVKKRVTYFLAEVTGTIHLQESEVSAGNWVEVNAAKHRVTYPEAKALCEKIQEALLLIT